VSINTEFVFTILTIELFGLKNLSGTTITVEGKIKFSLVVSIFKNNH